MPVENEFDLSRSKTAQAQPTAADFAGTPLTYTVPGVEARQGAKRGAAMIRLLVANMDPAPGAPVLSRTDKFAALFQRLVAYRVKEA